MKTNASKAAAATAAEKKRFDKKSVNTKVHPFINFQIGLVAALLLVFMIIEFTTEQVEKQVVPRQIVESHPQDWENKRFVEVPNEPVRKEPVKTVPKETPPEIVPDDTPEPDPDPDLQPDPEPQTQDAPVSKDIDAQPKSAPVAKAAPKTPIITTMDGVDAMPLFPGCESLDNNEERKECFNKKMTRFVQRKFDTSIANTIGLEEGTKVKITVLFTIDERGLPKDIQVRAPHKELEKESYRVIGKLPRITPGKIKGEPVSVYFALPIIFKVSN